MNLTPEIVADILVRQGYITPEQGETIRQEAKALPSRLRSTSAYEQKAVAYDLNFTETVFVDDETPLNWRTAMTTPAQTNSRSLT